jgi:predicted acetyltransferase
MPDFTLANPIDDRELAEYQDIVAQALHFPRDLADRYVKLVGRENFRIVRAGDRIAGGLAILKMGHFLGGRSVPTWGVAALGIAAEHRASGAATAMMRLALREMLDKGATFSSLYPATVPLYRRAGYELAGRREEITIPIRLLRPRERENVLRVERITPDDHAEIEALYRAEALQCAGLLDRAPISWGRVREPRGETATGFRVVNPATSRIEGYIYTLQKDAPPTQHTQYHLHITDAQFTTVQAGRRLLAMLYEHHSVCDTAIMFGSGDHPLITLIPERVCSTRLQLHWMARIVDVEKALAARGYDRHISAETHLDVRDDLLPENCGHFSLGVHDGEATIARGGSGDVVIDIRGLAALYTGHATTHDLVLTGQLHLAEHVRDGKACLAALDAIFRGPRPWLGDMF